MATHSPLQEIRIAAQAVQRVLGSLSFPGGKGVIVEHDLLSTSPSVKCSSKASDTGEQLINDAQLAAGLQASLDRRGLPNLDEEELEADVIEEEVVTCKPCRVHTHGQEKPEWAVHGCSPPEPYKEILEPQLPASERPEYRGWGSKIRQNGSGFSCIHPECPQKDHIFPKKQGAQQHARKHYPAEYKCQDCDGEWYLKTQWEQHFWVYCPDCNKRLKKGSLAAHAKNCNH
jgi:hypothetical protein